MSQSFGRRSLAIGLFLGLAVGSVLLTVLLQQSRSGLHWLQASRSGIIQTQSLVELVQRAIPAGAELQPLISGVAAKDKNIRSIRVIQGARLEASTAAEDTGDKAAPRRLAREEKPVYDQGQRLRAAVLTNQEEGVSRKSEIEVEELPSGGYSLAAPVEQDGAVTGFVHVETAVKPEPVGINWMVPLAATVLPVVAFLLIGMGLGDRRGLLTLAALLLLGLGLGWNSWYVRNEIAGERRGQETEIAALIQQESSVTQTALAGLGAAETAPLKPSSWDVDIFRHPRGLIDDSGRIQQAALDAEVEKQSNQIGNAIFGIAALSLLVTAFVGLGFAARLWGTFTKYREAYAYTAPAMLGMLVLVFFPFFYGIALSFTDSSLYNSDKSIPEVWSGIKNYIDILGDFSIVRSTDAGLIVNYQNFYWTLLFTVIWTISNVSIGVTLGLILALILNTKGLALRPLYRVLLIFPWAMPNYITALIWKGMFHQQFGVINQVLQIFGADPVSWFQRPTTSFLTALATNGWLSFPFMMVVSLGALQSIPSDLYEAARVDGATRWQQFKSITLPSLRPALVPAIILSVVWTFNMFNIIYLVTAGEPGGATEILITQAYKIAFEKYRYGYAAAYSTVIFIILLLYGTFQNKMTKATEAIA